MALNFDIDLDPSSLPSEERTRVVLTEMGVPEDCQKDVLTLVEDMISRFSEERDLVVNSALILLLALGVDNGAVDRRAAAKLIAVLSQAWSK